jgi:hypothetical protein
MGTPASLAIYDLHARRIWKIQDFSYNTTWNQTDLAGKSIPPGIYVYSLKVGDVVARGTVDIRR